MQDESRSPLVVVLLLLCLGVVAVLAAQTQAAVQSHRAMAEKVLRDYAALGADEFVRRATNELGFFGYYTAITALGEGVAGSPEAPLPEPVELAARGSGETRHALALVRTFYRFHPVRGTLETSGTALSTAEAAWLRAFLQREGARPLPAGRRYDARYARLEGALHGFVTLPRGGGALGFALEPRALAAALSKAVARGPLLPASLGGDGLGSDAFYLSLTDPFGGEILRSGTPVAGAVGAERRLGADYNGILQDFVVRASIDPAAAGKLLIGGLPRSRLPVLLTLLAVTAGLTLTAVLQLRRERALHRLRSDFVSRVSHELRTPLTQIRMFSETLLLERVRSEGERARYLGIIDREARRLSHLVENVLSFSRTERGRMALAPRPLDLAPVVRDLVEEFRPLAAGRHARLATEVREGTMASVDDDALRQVLLNLLDNAVKYGPEGQEVRVGVTPGSPGARVWVDDEGPGVPAGDRDRIWQRFFRLEAHRESAIAGTGIGLTVVRDLVALHGGRSWVETGARGGARFVVEFPG